MTETAGAFPWFSLGLALEATLAIFPRLQRKDLGGVAVAALVGGTYFAVQAIGAGAASAVTLALGTSLLVYAAILVFFFFGTYLPTIDERVIHVWSVVLACIFLFGPQPFAPWHAAPVVIGLLSLVPAFSTKPLSAAAKPWLYVWYLVMTCFFVLMQVVPGLGSYDAWSGFERVVAGMLSFQVAIALTVLIAAYAVPGKKHPTLEERRAQLRKVGSVLAERFDDDQHDPRLAVVLTVAVAGLFALNKALELVPFWSLSYGILIGALFLAEKLPSHAPRPQAP
jgi:hypothetical protein